MKHIIKKLIIPAVVLGGVLYASTNSPENTQAMPENVLANIEALTDTLIGPAIPSVIHCYGLAIKRPCCSYIDCSTCTRIEGWEAYGPAATCIVFAHP